MRWWTSAFFAVLKEEPEEDAIMRAGARSIPTRQLSAPKYLEAAIVIDANRNPVLSAASTI